MEAILVHPENQEQLKAVKTILKALKVPYKLHKEADPLYDLSKADIDEAYQEMREGKYEVVNTDDLWK